MQIAHIAIWARDLESLKDFYVQSFGCTCGAPYHNPAKKFSSYFLSLGAGPRIELMHKEGLAPLDEGSGLHGLAHFALSLGSKEEVDRVTKLMRTSGHRIIGEPRWTGDGYYESVMLDPEGNQIELTV